jgi:hypothetical protein
MTPSGGLTLDKQDNAAVIPTSSPGDTGWLALEDGVDIQFVDPQNSVYRTGDYWLIPARVATGDIERPGQTVPGDPKKRPLSKFPDGDASLLAWFRWTAPKSRAPPNAGCNSRAPGRL